jgi:hypothetical protein
MIVGVPSMLAIPVYIDYIERAGNSGANYLAAKARQPVSEH